MERNKTKQNKTKTLQILAKLTRFRSTCKDLNVKIILELAKWVFKTREGQNYR